ncbi:MAG TPA: response regulator, partial [Candidatus Sulfotelmatobacter sp.]|nr:response regulator [Candidatus Sulfotelmatobacter sp.]
LRTPLNSILVLGQQLSDNPDGNLTPKQVEFSRTIHGAGTDLLNLITDILDLSKIESGTVSVEADEVFFASMLDALERPFKHEAENRHLGFEVKTDPHLSRSLVTDAKRLQQVLKNLLSNAFKFTESGGIRLAVTPAKSGWTEGHPILSQSASVIAFEVSDTGIGIPFEKQRIIFEAFQQADAGTSRKYGGTGLGLAISRELASLLGGEIQLRSAPGRGSTFTLYLPQTYVGPSTASAASIAAGAQSDSSASVSPVRISSSVVTEHVIEKIGDDRDNLHPDDAVLLVVEDDPHYARVLRDLSRDKGFKVLVASRGAEALALAHEYHPTAVSLDVFLPDMLGWTVLNHLKQDPTTRHIPVQMLTLDEDRHHGLARGAFAFVTKPTTPEGLESALTRIKEYSTPRRKRLLVVEDNPAEQLSIKELLGYDDIDVTVASTGAEAIEIAKDEGFDCVVLDLRLPDISGFDVLDKFSDIPSLADLPVVVFTGKELTPEEDARLHSLARSVVVKGVESPERLLDETALFLHRVVTDLPAEKQRLLDRLHRSDDALVGKKVLVVDDDVRNIFALSSVIERRGMTVITAGTGREAIAKLESTPDIAIVLMDIMMPEMDGYETMQVIRQNAAFRRLPIIALTAKAMKGDREKCLEAGASEYLAKPVNTEQLLSSLRMWLHR